MAAPAYTKTPGFEVASNFIKSDYALVSTLGGITLPNGTYAVPNIQGDKLTNGTAAGKTNIVSKLYLVSATGNTDYDLTALVDGLGNALNFANVRYVSVFNFATTAAYNLTIDGTVTNAWGTPFSAVATAKLIVPPGWLSGTQIIPGRFLLGGGSAAGMAVGASNKVIRIGAGANTILHGLIVSGVSA